MEDYYLVGLGLMTYAIPVPVPLGVVERTAAGIKARFDEWPKGYIEFCIKHCGGGVPSRVTNLVEKLKEERPWERCRHGTNLALEVCLRCAAEEPELILSPPSPGRWKKATWK